MRLYPVAMLEPSAQDWFLYREQAYQLVAKVAAPLEDVFALTNHQHEGGWTSNQEVIVHSTAPVRSTSVGDVIVNEMTGEAWLIMPVGRKPIASIMPSSSLTIAAIEVCKPPCSRQVLEVPSGEGVQQDGAA